LEFAVWLALCFLGRRAGENMLFFNDVFFLPIVASLIILFEEAGSLGWGGLERSLGQPFLGGFKVRLFHSN
jgi:hypothetical protein